MDILLTNQKLDTRSGTEMWTRTAYRTLTMLGHDVRVKTFQDVPWEYQRDDGREYDLALINHHQPRSIKAKCKIYTSHGIKPGVEEPKPGADFYVGVSEEVKDKYRFGHIIRNPIDLVEFIPRTPVNHNLTNILVMSNRSDHIHNQVRRVFPECSIIRLGGKQNKPFVHRYMDYVDLVITLGRGVYEAMAMNRNVLVYDYAGSDGFITPHSYSSIRAFNCSGRLHGMELSDEELRKLVDTQYDPTMKLRNIIEKDHDSVKIMYQYLDLYRKR